MGKDSGIEWTHHTFNPHWGCVRVSPGCENCYAETFSHRLGFTAWGVKGERREFGDSHWNEPLKWNAVAEKAGERHRVFCASMADVFEDHPIAARSRDRLWPLIAATPSLDWLLLTKRPENMIRFHPHPWAPNEWAGCTVEDQQRANERIPRLLSVPSFVRFLSVEPMLGAVELTRLHDDEMGAHWNALGMGIHWVICGGESGNGSRPMSAMWARSLRDQCVAAGVAFHFKQWGQHTDAGSLVRKKHDAGRILDGRTWDEFPVTHGR